jgi:hypothetical protein
MTDYADIVRHAALVERTRSLIRMVSPDRLDEVAAMVREIARGGELSDADVMVLGEDIERRRGRAAWRRARRISVDDLGPPPRRPFVR